MFSDIVYQQMLDQFPGLIYFTKDKNHVYQQMNKNLCDILLLDSSTVIGKTDYEFPFKSEADKYIEQDKYAFKGNIQFNIDTPNDANGIKKVLLVKKTPLYQNNIDLLGVLGMGFYLNKENFSNITRSIAASNLRLDDFVSETKDEVDEFIYGNVCFSRRQAQILCDILRGYTAASIADRLHLSQRTIEHYFETIKDKLNCQNKSEIIGKAFDLGFIDLMFMTV